MRKRKQKSREQLAFNVAVDLLKLFTAMLGLLTAFLKLLLTTKE